MCISLHILAMFDLISLDGKLKSLNILSATENSASAGHDANQSKVQQSMREGNLRHLTLKASPTGLIHNIICRFSRTRSTKV